MREGLLRTEEHRDLKIRSQLEQIDEKMAIFTEKFDQRFQTNENLKRELDQQMQFIVKAAVDDVKNAFL